MASRIVRAGCVPPAAASAGAARTWRRLRRAGSVRMLLLGALVALHLVLFLGVFPSSQNDGGLTGFIDLSYQDSGRALAGSVPYHDFLLEYPPGLLLFMLAPRLFAVSPLAYHALFFAELAGLDLVLVVTLGASARAAGLSTSRVLILYTVAIVLLGPLVAYRLDLAPAACVALALLAWQRGRTAPAAIALAIGAATKVYPVVLLPPLLAGRWLEGKRREAWWGAACAMLTLATILSPALRAGPQALLHSLRFQSGRHTEIEALWATPPLILRVLSGFPLSSPNVDRAYVILGPGDALGALGMPALVLIVGLIYWRWLRRAGDGGQPERVIVLEGCAALVLATAILSKVLSPQYLIWAIPPLALLPPRSWAARVSVGAFLLALPLTQWIFPLHFAELVHLATPATVAALALRNGLLLVALAALVIAYCRATRGVTAAR